MLAHNGTISTTATSSAGTSNWFLPQPWLYKLASTISMSPPRPHRCRRLLRMDIELVAVKTTSSFSPLFADLALEIIPIACLIPSPTSLQPNRHLFPHSTSQSSLTPLSAYGDYQSCQIGPNAITSTSTPSSASYPFPNDHHCLNSIGIFESILPPSLRWSTYPNQISFLDQTDHSRPCCSGFRFLGLGFSDHPLCSRLSQASW